MSVLVLQIIIKQWDKSQRSEAHKKMRANIPDRYPLIFPPALYVFGSHCVLDQHGDDIQGSRIKYFKDAEGKIKLDRFQITADNTIEYYGSQEKQVPRRIASLNNQWIQCKYNCRYSIFESDMYYWLYEEITLNAVCLNTVNENLFLNAEPDIIYEDLIDLDKKK